ncbi:hypothetical protein AB0F35_38665 [Streptomyces collinus]
MSSTAKVTVQLHPLDAAMRGLIEVRQWLTVFRFPSYTSDLNPAEGVGGHLKNRL